jgi:elongation factor G
MPAQDEIEYQQPIAGKTQYAKVSLVIEPADPADGVQFTSRIKRKDNIPEAFIEAVKQGVFEASSGGELAGYPVLGAHVFLKNLGIREDDTTEMACKIASSMIFRQAYIKAEPVILEPMMRLEIVMPDEYVGTVINDLNSRRGKVTKIATRREQQIVDADVPLSEMFGYTTVLRSLTQGRAVYTMQFSQYKQTSKAVQEALLKRIGRF